MATYLELYQLRENSGLLEKVAVAVSKKAQVLIDNGAATTAQIAWAKEALSSPYAKGQTILYYVLAKNSALTVTQIQDATDAAIQANVDNAVDALIAGGV